MTCEEAERRLSWYLDGEAPEVAPHLAECERCRTRLEALRKADALLSQAAARFAPEVQPRVAARFRRRRFVRRGAMWAAALFVAGFLGSWIWVNERQADPQEVLVFGAQKWVAGATAILRVVVRDGSLQAPIPGAVVQASLEGAQSEAISGADGSAEIRLRAPDRPSRVRIEVSSRAGRDTIERDIEIVSPVRLLVSTDKPVYQPSQAIRIRVLALASLTMRPFEGDLDLVVEDPNGNRVFRKALTTSEFGIAAADFVLADEVNFGTYRIRGVAGDASSERTVEVKRYVLPKFKVDLQADRGFYLPGETIRATLEAAYMFGKPVAGGEVRVEVSSWVADRFMTFATAVARTDPSGRASIETRLPERLWGTDLSGGEALLRLEAVVTDGAGHTERKAVASVASGQPLRVQVIPEGGRFVPGLAQQMYVVVSYPDGRPARATVEIEGKAARQTDEAGVVVAPAGGPFGRIRVRDDKGNSAECPMQDTYYPGVDQFLVRTDRVSYRAGQTLKLTVLSRTDGAFYVDLVKSDQTLLTRSMEVRRGQGTLSMDLPAELFGTVRLSVYHIGRDGHLRRRSLPIIVDLPGDLAIRPAPAKASFEPGEEIEVGFEVLDSAGRPVVAALGLSVVDEAVFALAESRPGFEKTYFQIEEELLKPRWQLKPLAPSPSAIPAPVHVAASTEPSIDTFASAFYLTKRNALEAYARKYNERMANVLGYAIGIPVLGGFVCIIVLAIRRKRLLYVTGFLLVIFVMVIAILPATLSSQRASVSMPPVAAAMRLESEGREIDQIDRAVAGPASPRIREFFPETLYWNPQVVTDESGRASVRIPGADSITTWRMSMSAVTRTGSLGGGDHPIRVFQPFFVDLDLPITLTQGDEVWLPVSVYNYLREPQSVALSFEAESGFEIVGGHEKRIDVKPGDVTGVRFHLRAREFGTHRLTVKAVGTTFSDAVRRSIEVLPDGKESRVAVGNRARGSSRTAVTIPREAIDGTARAWLRIFPSTFSEVVTGLEGLVRMPYG